MTRADTLAERDEYLSGGLCDLRCDRCGTIVRARKASPMQTSVQWTRAAARFCVRLRTAAAGRPTALVPTCPDLSDSIERAVREGRLAVRG